MVVFGDKFYTHNMSIVSVLTSFHHNNKLIPLTDNFHSMITLMQFTVLVSVTTDTKSTAGGGLA